jgi:hypothetical protein
VIDPWTAAMIVTTIVQAGLSIAGANQQAESLKEQAQFRAMALASNRKLAEFQAQEAIDAGNTEANKIKTYQQKVIGSQQASLAAQGLDTTSGTALNLQQETNYFAERDIQTTKNNAWKEAWGIKINAEQMGLQGKFADMATQSQINSTYLTGGLQALNYGLQAANVYRKNAGTGAPSKTGGHFNSYSGE